jgi:hypothetical protein
MRWKIADLQRSVRAMPGGRHGMRDGTAAADLLQWDMRSSFTRKQTVPVLAEWILLSPVNAIAGNLPVPLCYMLADVLTVFQNEKFEHPDR